MYFSFQTNQERKLPSLKAGNGWTQCSEWMSKLQDKTRQDKAKLDWQKYTHQIGCMHAIHRLMTKALYLSRVWADTSVSAAGLRLRRMLAILSRDCKMDVTFATTTNSFKREMATELEENLGIQVKSCEMNRFKMFTKMVEDIEPEVVIFDTFVVEEMFSWQLHEVAPNCMRVLDMQDFHSLRKWRERLHNRQKKKNIGEILNCFPDASDRLLQREIASILKSDLTVAVNEVEAKLLTEKFSIPCEKVEFATLLGGSQNFPRLPFEARQHFYFIGNFQHRPNEDAVLFLFESIWPKLRTFCPRGTELHIFGPNSRPEFAKRVHAPGKGFHFKGQLQDLSHVGNYKCLLAPLRFGAGVKGKITEAMDFGTPFVTTSIGAEGIFETSINTFDTASEFVSRARLLFNDRNAWLSAQEFGDGVSQSPSLSLALTSKRLQQKLLNVGLESGKRGLVQQILLNEEYASKKFMSKFIELKETRQP